MKKTKGKISFFDGDYGKIKIDSAHVIWPSKEIDFTIEEIQYNHGEISVGDYVEFIIKNISGNLCASRISNVGIVGIEKSKIKRRTKSSFEHFESVEQLKNALNYILIKLNSCLSNAERFEHPDDIKSACQGKIQLINDLLLGKSPNISDISIDHINDFKKHDKEVKRSDTAYWLHSFNLKKFKNEIEELLNLKFKNKNFKQEEFVWNEWELKTKQTFYSGYTEGDFKYSFIEKGDSDQTHVYNHPPKKSVWKCMEIKQKSHTFYIASAAVNEIAQTSYVPSLPPKVSISEIADRILDREKKTNEWQREVDVKRMMKIQHFIEESDNIIANTPMLFIHNPDCVKITDSQIEIDYNNFLKKEDSGEFENLFIDRKKRNKPDEFGNTVYDDFRPLWLIDGQHRVKGIHRNEHQQSLTIPIIIFPTDFGVNSTAKVFAEINTLQKKLNPLHELFMQHRFCIDHTNDKRKFRDFYSTPYEVACDMDWKEDWLNSRANHLSYRIAARLSKNGPLKNRIVFLPQNEVSDHQVLISADQWVNYTRSWFKDTPYEFSFKKLSHASEEENYYKEINNYFKAWKAISSNNWGKKTPKQLIESKTPFQILLELYSLIRNKAKRVKKEKGLNGLISIDEFREILKPFINIDWTNKEIKEVFPSSGEKGRRSLEVWMADAIIHGNSYTLNEIINEDKRSEPSS